MHVYYDGHAGPETLVNLRNPTQGRKFSAGQVRELDRLDGLDLCRLGGFVEALTSKEAAERFGLTQKALKERVLDRAGGPDASKDEWILLTPTTSSAIRAALGSPA